MSIGHHIDELIGGSLPKVGDASALLGGSKRVIDVDRLGLIASFVAVCELGSFVGAAAAVQSSPSTVSRKVSQLESFLGLRLLERNTRHIALTEAGRMYHRMCHEIFDRLADADALMASFESTPRGVLKLSAPLAFGRLHIAPVLHDFLNRYPDIKVQADFTDRYVDLIEEGYDAAVRVGKLADSSLIARRIATNRRYVVASPAYLQEYGTPLCPADLEHHNCLSFTRYAEASDRWTFSKEDVTAMVKISGSLTSDNSDAICEAAASGLGIGLVAGYLCDSGLRRGSLVSLLDDWRSVPETSIFVAYPSRRYLAPKVRVFIEFLIEKSRAARWL